MTHYEVLGVDQSAPAAEVRRAYLRLARQHHPDFFVASGPGAQAEAERRMRAINQAWAVLGHQGRRAAYDRSARLVPPGGDRSSENRPFQPFDDGEDDIDPRDLPDQPYRNPADQPSRLTKAATLAPVGAFAASIVAGAVGMVVGSAGLIALALVSFLAACLGFVVMPLVALSQASRNE